MPRPRDWYDVKGYWSLSGRTYWNRATIRRTACFFHVVHLTHSFENYWTSSRLPLEYLSASKAEISSRPTWIIFINSIREWWNRARRYRCSSLHRGVRSVIPFVFASLVRFFSLRTSWKFSEKFFSIPTWRQSRFSLNSIDRALVLRQRILDTRNKFLFPRLILSILLKI